MSHARERCQAPATAALVTNRQMDGCPVEAASQRCPAAHLIINRITSVPTRLASFPKRCIHRSLHPRMSSGELHLPRSMYIGASESELLKCNRRRWQSAAHLQRLQMVFELDSKGLERTKR